MNKHDPLKCLDGTALKLIAMVCMFIDHGAGILFPERVWMHCVGRLAFPIFAFQIAQGYDHTRSFWAYLKRLVLLALISEIPYNRIHGSWLYPAGQNVIFTFCVALGVMRVLDQKQPGPGVLALAGGVALATLLHLDYGGWGVLMVLLFWALNRGYISWAAVPVLMLLIQWVALGGPMLAPGLPVQAFGMLALIPIWLHNGRKGWGGKTFQYGVYLFYPAHMLLLGLLL